LLYGKITLKDVCRNSNRVTFVALRSFLVVTFMLLDLRLPSFDTLNLIHNYRGAFSQQLLNFANSTCIICHFKRLQLVSVAQ